MGFFGEMFGFNPMEKKQETGTVAERGDAAMSSLVDRARKSPEGSRGRRFFTHAALFTALIAGGEAKAHEPGSGTDEPTSVWQLRAGGRASELREKLEWIQEEEARLVRDVAAAERRVETLERTHDRRMQDEALPLDSDLIMAKRELRQKERLLEITENREERLEGKLEKAAGRWQENREGRHDVIDVYASANPELREKMTQWGFVFPNESMNTVGIPVLIDKKINYRWLTVNEAVVGVGFHESASTLRIVFELVDHTYTTFVVTYNVKEQKGVLTEKIEHSDDKGKPVQE